MTYAHKIEARDRALDHTRPAEEVERVVRALRPHIGARLPLPDGSLPRRRRGARRRRDAGAAPAAACGADGERLLLDCNGGALELLEVQPPGSRRDGRRRLAARPPRSRARQLLARPAAARRARWTSSSELAISEWRSDAEWPPYLAALAWRGDEAVLDAARELSRRDDPRARAVAAYVLGQLGVPERTFPADERRRARGARGARGGPRGAGDDRERVRPPRRAARRSRRCCACAATPTRASARARPTRWPAATTSACSTR